MRSYDSKAIQPYVHAVNRAVLWHGTGRYQYANGKIIDVFSNILQSGALHPVKDKYALLIGGEETTAISTTPLRIIARAYADTHGKGSAEKSRYGAALWWVAYYYSCFYAEIFTRHGAAIVRNLSNWSKATRDHTGERLWGKKVRRGAVSVWDVFGSGSDIEGNYPILFGIATYQEKANIPQAMEKTEIRIMKPVRMKDLSHIEVPENKVSEIKQLLQQRGYNVPVFPIELGEFMDSKKTVSRTDRLTVKLHRAYFRCVPPWCF